MRCSATSWTRPATRWTPPTTSATLSRIGVIATAGDRRDADMSELGEVAARHFDVVIVREDTNLRGRAREVADLVAAGVRRRWPTGRAASRSRSCWTSWPAPGTRWPAPTPATCGDLRRPACRGDGRAGVLRPSGPARGASRRSASSTTRSATRTSPPARQADSAQFGLWREGRSRPADAGPSADPVQRLARSSGSGRDSACLSVAGSGRAGSEQPGSPRTVS